MTATLIEIGALDRARPAADAAPTVVAAWYDRKAVVLRHIADDAWSRSERDTYRRWADEAHAHAARLLAAAGAAGGGVW